MSDFQTQQASLSQSQALAQAIQRAKQVSGPGPLPGKRKSRKPRLCVCICIYNAAFPFPLNHRLLQRSNRTNKAADQWDHRHQREEADPVQAATPSSE